MTWAARAAFQQKNYVQEEIRSETGSGYATSMTL